MRSTLPVDPPRRIAVVRALFLGDLLCAVPALDALDRRFPDAEIVLIGLPWARELVAKLPALDRFVEFAGYPGIPEVAYDERRTAAFLEAMRDERFDLAIQLHGSGEVINDLMAALGAGATVGYAPPGDRTLSIALRWREDENEIERWLRLVAVLGAEAAGTRIRVPITDAEHERAESLLTAAGSGCGPLVGLHCGSKLVSRRWPVDRFARLADELSARHGARIVLTGSNGERDLAAAVRARTRTELLDLVGRTDLGTFLALVSRLDLLVTNDTGASHVAAATRTPSVVLFGPSRPSRWAPLDRSLHTVIDTRAVVGLELPDDDYLRHLPLEPVREACERALELSGIRSGGRQGRRPAASVERA